MCQTFKELISAGQSQQWSYAAWRNR